MPLADETRKALEEAEMLIPQLENAENLLKRTTATFLMDEKVPSVPQHQIVQQLLQSSASIRNAITQIQAAAQQTKQL